MRYRRTVRRLVTLALLGGCPGHQHVAIDGPSAPDAGIDDASVAPAAGFRSQVIYLALVDRFADADPSNDGAGGCFDPTNAKAFHGGDFEGLRQHLDYLQDL